jgi:hypothetical protein
MNCQWARQQRIADVNRLSQLRHHRSKAVGRDLAPDFGGVIGATSVLVHAQAGRRSPTAFFAAVLFLYRNHQAVSAQCLRGLFEKRACFLCIHGAAGD